MQLKVIELEKENSNLKS